MNYEQIVRANNAYRMETSRDVGSPVPVNTNVNSLLLKPLDVKAIKKSRICICFITYTYTIDVSTPRTDSSRRRDEKRNAQEESYLIRRETKVDSSYIALSN